jgi:RNA-directed DNA polymerase
MIIERMARELGLTPTFIELRSHRASHEYKEYRVKKRDGGTRTIHHPSRALKALQRWLLANIIEALPIHSSAFAYRKGYSIFDNAKVHRQSKYLLRMDLANFFPSIKQSDLLKYIQDRPTLFLEWTTTDIAVFCQFVCRYGVLTIGAPTSPALSNAICYEMDVQIHELCAKNGVNYSRYADDLFFSSDHPDVLFRIELGIKQIITELRLPEGLRLNANKTRHSSKRGVRRVTGIVLGSDAQVYVGRSFKRKVRALIHKFHSLTPEQRTSLAGMIAYVIGFEPRFMNSLISKYDLTLVRQATKPKS